MPVRAPSPPALRSPLGQRFVLLHELPHCERFARPDGAHAALSESEQIALWMAHSYGDDPGGSLSGAARVLERMLRGGPIAPARALARADALGRR
jgi:hypothetical protein